MLRTILYAFLLFVSILNASAIDQGNFYGGVGIGYTNIVGPLNRTLRVGGEDKSVSIGEGKVLPTFFIGAQSVATSGFYLAIEAFHHISNIKITKSENTFPGFVNYLTYIKEQNKTGLVGKIGFAHLKNIFYLKAGLSSHRFILNFTNNAGGRNREYNTSLRQNNLLLGGGVEYSLTKNMSVGLEYDVVKHLPLKFSPNNVGEFRFKPMSHTFQLRVKYVFI